MVKSDLIISLAEKVNLPFRDVEMAVNEILERMSSALADGLRIEIRSFGSYRLNHCPPRRAHNPKTG